GANLPKDVRRLGAAAQDYLATGCRGQRGRYLEDEDRVGVALGVECQIAGGYVQRGGGFVEAGGKSHAAQISRYCDGCNCSSSGVVIGCGQVQLGLCCRGIGYKFLPDHFSRRESSHRGTRAESKISLDGRKATVGHGGPRQNREIGGCSQ